MIGITTEIKVGRPSVTTWLLRECLTPEVQPKLRVLMPLAWEPPNSNHRRMKLDKGVAGGHFGPAFAKPCPKVGAKPASRGGLRKDVCKPGLL